MVASHRPSLAAQPDEAGAKRALIFAGGGLRLSYQAGVAQALDEAGLTFTHFEGTSGGGINLAMLLSGLTPREMCRRWRDVSVFDFLALRPVGKYLRSKTAVALGSSAGLRRRAFPALGIDYAAIRAAEGVDAWFNVYNFTTKEIEHVAHAQANEDVLIAGLSLPGLLPPVKRGLDLYLDAGFRRDADPVEAVKRGAEEVWIVWCLGDVPEYTGGPVNIYVQTLELCAVGALHEDIARLAEINERIARGETVYGHSRPVRLHLIRPPQPLPLDTDLYNGRVTHSALIDQGYADAVRYIEQAGGEGLPLRPEITRMASPAIGLTFRETMAGAFALGETDPRAGAAAGERAGTHLAMHANVAIDSMRDFVDDPEHPGGLTGHVDFAPWGEGIPATQGVFNLFTPASPPGMKHMVYELQLRHEGKTYYLAGRKEVRGDHAGLDLWPDTTTLLTTLHEGEDATGPVVGAGVLTLGPDDLARLVSTVRVTGPASTAERASTIATFGAFFMGELWDTYATPLYAPESRWRRALRRLLGMLPGRSAR
ncbi:MAG: patatin-like phospholipase family protein [Dehalococcoidia bacterium]